MESYKLSSEHHQYNPILSSCVIHFYSASFRHDLSIKAISSPYPKLFCSIFNYLVITHQKPEGLASLTFFLFRWMERKKQELIFFFLARKIHNPAIAPARTAAVELSVPGTQSAVKSVVQVVLRLSWTCGVVWFWNLWSWWNDCVVEQLVLVVRLELVELENWCAGGWNICFRYHLFLCHSTSASVSLIRIWNDQSQGAGCWVGAWFHIDRNHSEEKVGGAGDLGLSGLLWALQVWLFHCNRWWSWFLVLLVLLALFGFPPGLL